MVTKLNNFKNKTMKQTFSRQSDVDDLESYSEYFAKQDNKNIDRIKEQIQNIKQSSLTHTDKRSVLFTIKQIIERELFTF